MVVSYRIGATSNLSRLLGDDGKRLLAYMTPEVADDLMSFVLVASEHENGVGISLGINIVTLVHTNVLRIVEDTFFAIQSKVRRKNDTQSVLNIVSFILRICGL